MTVPRVVWTKLAIGDWLDLNAGKLAWMMLAISGLLFLCYLTAGNPTIGASL